ncbi:hypothetical protein F0562_030600 [Nyssa sinensis]|uniref:Uncharacterized protein n=1 Tax=Nyssa sinensis TaxID=561372 RepID=A0A5J5B1D0_9ASTE|nr:hypothetical protein F0562_030600 [Nyssa sinensis]
MVAMEVESAELMGMKSPDLMGNDGCCDDRMRFRWWLWRYGRWYWLGAVVIYGCGAAVVGGVVMPGWGVSSGAVVMEGESLASAVLHGSGRSYGGGAMAENNGVGVGHVDLGFEGIGRRGHDELHERKNQRRSRWVGGARSVRR